MLIYSKDISNIPDLDQLAELRINNNKLMFLPEKLKYLPKLGIIEVGNNRIQNIKYSFYCYFW